METMTDRFSKTAMGLLLVWMPLAYYVRSSEGFTLPKEFTGLLALGLLGGILFGSGARLLFRQPLPLTMGLFLVWMAGDAWAVAPVKSLAFAGMVHLVLAAGTLWAVVLLCARGLSYARLLRY
ncbi:MAG TPA: hypothetical protein VFR02_03530, partial [bacterium]|nr:hypothetical protein [bacterium]